MRHLDNMAKIILVTGSMVGYAYLMEFFMAWYSGNPLGAVPLPQPRARARCGWCGWMMLVCNAVVPQVFWFKLRPAQRVGAVRRLHAGERGHVVRAVRDHRRRACTAISCRRVGASYCPSYVEVLTLVGSFGLFLTLFLLFCRYLPMVAMAEVKSILPGRSRGTDTRSSPDRPGWPESGRR